MKWYQRVLHILLIAFLWAIAYPAHILSDLWGGFPISETHIEFCEVTKELWEEATE